MAAKRAAESLLRSTGGRSIFLRVPVPAALATTSEELGLVAPAFQEVELSPVVFRKGRPQQKGDGERWELLVSTYSVEAVLGDSGATDASSLFASAAGVVVDEDLMEIEAISSSDMNGVPYVYRLVVRVPQAKTI